MSNEEINRIIDRLSGFESRSNTTHKVMEAKMDSVIMRLDKINGQIFKNKENIVSLEKKDISIEKDMESLRIFFSDILVKQKDFFAEQRRKSQETRSNWQGFWFSILQWAVTGIVGGGFALIVWLITQGKLNL